MPTTMTLRLKGDVKTRLDKLADATQRRKSFLAADLIREIKTALREANGGDFASDIEVAALTKKWTQRWLNARPPRRSGGHRHAF